MKRLWLFVMVIFWVTIMEKAFVAEKHNFYSQYNQDKFIYENFFHNKKEGVFIDIGAYDGLMLSNSKFFEDTMNWTGICIEPEYFMKQTDF